MAQSITSLVRLEHVTKAFPGVVALDDVTLDLRAGEVHSILGENGAGKTTLMSVLFGLVHPNEGRILIDGAPARIRSPKDAGHVGISYVQQHFSLIPTLTVAENVALSVSSDSAPFSVALASKRVIDLGTKFGLEVDPEQLVASLSVGLQQRVELIKAIAGRARILILDEPGSSLTPQQSREISGVVMELAASGVGVFYISHSLDEVLRVSDRISVLRRGRLVATFGRDSATSNDLAKAMVGESGVTVLSDSGRARPVPKDLGPVRLSARQLFSGDETDGEVRDVSFEVRGGEVLGIAGVEGSGQVALTEALAGSRPFTGQVLVDGTSLGGRPVAVWQDHGVGQVPGDRRRYGVIPSLSVAESLALPQIGQRPLSRFGVVDWRRVRELSRDLMRRFDIRAGGPDSLVSTLSGGNQQKVVLARALARKPAVIVCCFPTRGLDFAAAESVIQVLRTARDDGSAIVLASLDLDELLSVSDRVLVLHHGELAGILQAHDATPERLGLMMGGVHAT